MRSKIITTARRITSTGLTVANLLGTAPAALAQTTGQDPFQAAAAKLQGAQSNITMLVSLIGFLGICGLVVMCYFNRMQWKWAFSLIGGFIVLALASMGINYFTSLPGATGITPLQ